ncbi:MAG: hypothetical protein MPN21_15495 [Thermoanaerobaculia bacterium]|nr:hypothetical protein [Thermoanaerobaculia bacterium]
MSFSFYIHQVLDVSLKDTLAALPFDSLVVDAEVPDQGWPKCAHIYIDNVSVRSIETVLEKGTLQVRIFVASSPDDMALAAAIVTHVAGRYGRSIEPEDGESLSIEDWRQKYGTQWQQEHCDAGLRTIAAFYREEGSTMQLSGTRATFHAGPRVMEPLLSEPSSFAERFWALFRRRNYLDREDLFGPSLMVVRVDDERGKCARIAALGPEVPTAISTQATFVTLRADGGDMFHVPLDDFVTAAADSITWLGDDLFVTPGYAGTAWSSLLSAVGPLALGLEDRPELLIDCEDTEASDMEGGEAGSQEIGDGEGIALASGLIATFLCIAGADGSVDGKEIRAFQRSLLSDLDDSTMAMGISIAYAVNHFEKLTKSLVESGPETMLLVVAAARQQVENLFDADEARTYAERLYGMAEDVAKASGGFFGFGNKISKEEATALRMLKKLLSLDEDVSQ